MSCIRSLCSLLLLDTSPPPSPLSDAWLDTVDDGQTNLKMYLQKQKERGVYSDDEEEENEGDENGDII